MSKDIYVVGTGLSHDGSVVILKNGEVAIGIEKERITRIKHDGGNDTLALEYCLNALGIDIEDIAIVVQTENFVVPDQQRFLGPRLFGEFPKEKFFTISHHLAHAYSTIGTCPFEEFNILIIDGCGSPFEQCKDLINLSQQNLSLHLENGFYCEKDSFYFFDGERLHSLFKDFSELAGPKNTLLPTTLHSIGGFYAAVSQYCFGGMGDAGKLMGLAPYGKKPTIEYCPFLLENGRIFLKKDWSKMLISPSDSYECFSKFFQHYADIAYWAQVNVESAISYVFKSRQELYSSENWCYSGGVALNAVMNGKLLANKIVKNLYIEPAAGDNGLALGCAYYGWLEILKKKKVEPNGNTFFGKTYSKSEIIEAIQESGLSDFSKELPEKELIELTAKLIFNNYTIAWFQGKSEFGPRALGHRSILANSAFKNHRDHINQNIKGREDFRPFAPAVLESDMRLYFKNSFNKSPYMLLVDEVNKEYAELFQATMHVDGSARIQSVNPTWNAKFHMLLMEIKKLSGHGIVLNTSLNKKGQPIVETPSEAIELFLNSSLDYLVLDQFIISKSGS